MLQATIVAAVIIAIYFRFLWFPKLDSRNWREIVRAKDWGVAVYVALAAWVLIFAILSGFVLATK